MTFRCLAGGVLVAVCLLGSPRAQACSLPCEENSALAPGAPANVPAIPISGGSPRLFGPDGGLIATALTTDALFSRLLVPSVPLQADAGYVLEFDSACAADGGLRSTFEAGAARALPTALGTVVVGAQQIGALTTWTSCGSCTAEMKAAGRTLTMALPADFLPWAEATRFALYVDGAPFARSAQPFDLLFAHDWFGPTAPGEVSFLAYGRCVRQGASSDEDEGLTMGSHTAEVHALIAGDPTAIVSAPFTFTLSCDGVCIQGPDGCRVTLPPCDAGVADAGEVDAGAPDAGPGDAGTSEPPDGGTTRPPGPAGCGCDAAPMALAWGALLLGQLRRRRR